MSIEANIKSIADSLAVIAAAVQNGKISGPAAEKTEPKAPSETPKKPAAKKPAAKKPDPKPDPKPEVEAEEETEEETEETTAETSDVTAPDPCTKEDLRTTLVKVTEEIGRDAVVALFQRFGVPNLKALPESKYADAWVLGTRALAEGSEVIFGSDDD